MKDKILIDNGIGYVLVNIADIIWFEIRSRKISMLFREDGQEKRIDFYDSLGNIASKIGENNFVRIHRSFLISLEYIDSVQNGIVKMKDERKTCIPVGRSYMADLMENVIKSSTLI